MSDNYILAIIPARGGSKGIPRKNIKTFAEYPLIYWSIKQANESKYITRTIVSTDDDEIKNTALKYGAEVPFIRPKEISDDLSHDFEFMSHCLEWLQTNENKVPDLIVQLRPTYPTRKVEIIDQCIECLLNDKHCKYDSLRTVIPTTELPFKMYTVHDQSYLKPLFNEYNDIKEPYNHCRQRFPQTYLHNGYVDVIRTNTILNAKSVTGSNIYPYIMTKDEYHDIDTLEDWKNAEKNIFTIYNE